MKRVSKYELIRIIAMFMIVLHHLFIHGILVSNISGLLSQKYIYKFGGTLILGSMGKIGVFLFVLITGFFMCNSKTSLFKLLKLWIPIFFWSVTIYLFMSAINDNAITLRKLIKSMFPIIFDQYWFMTDYFFLYLLIPFLNKIVISIKDKKQILLFSLLGLLLIFSSNGFILNGTGSMLLNFCVIYCWGGLIKKNEFIVSRKLKIIKIICLTLCLTYVLLLEIFTFLLEKTKNPIYLKIINQVILNPGVVITVLISVFLFMWLINLNIVYSKWINIIASTTFGIYLISDNQLIRPWLWKKIFNVQKIFYENYSVLFLIFIAFIVFFACGLLEYCRKICFSKFENKLLRKVDKMFSLLFAKFIG